MSISSIVVRGFGAFANGLLATLGFGQLQPVGPGICAESAIFVGMGFEGAVLPSGAGYCLESTTAGAVVFNGGHEGAIIPMMVTGAEYT